MWKGILQEKGRKKSMNCFKLIKLNNVIQSMPFVQLNQVDSQTQFKRHFAQFFQQKRKMKTSTVQKNL